MHSLIKKKSFVKKFIHLSIFEHRYCIYAFEHKHILSHTHTHRQTHAHTCIQTYTHAHIYRDRSRERYHLQKVMLIAWDLWLSLWLSLSLSLSIYLSINLFVYIYIYIYIYIVIHGHTFSSYHISSVCLDLEGASSRHRNPGDVIVSIIYRCWQVL